MSEELKPCPYVKQAWFGSDLCGLKSGISICVGLDKCCIYDDIAKQDKRIEELEEMLASVLNECSACSDIEPRECRLGEQIKKVLKGADHE